jgi:excisionase family DNA binding protein
MTERQVGLRHAAEQDGAHGIALLTVRGVAQMLGMSPRWVHERVRRREIPYYKFGTALRFDPEEIRRWIAQYRSAPSGAGKER